MTSVALSIAARGAPDKHGSGNASRLRECWEQRPVLQASASSRATPVQGRQVQGSRKAVPGVQSQSPRASEQGRYGGGAESPSLAGQQGRAPARSTGGNGRCSQGDRGERRKGQPSPRKTDWDRSQGNTSRKQNEGHGASGRQRRTGALGASRGHWLRARSVEVNSIHSHRHCDDRMSSLVVGNLSFHTSPGTDGQSPHRPQGPGLRDGAWVPRPPGTPGLVKVWGTQSRLPGVRVPPRPWPWTCGQSTAHTECRASTPSGRYTWESQDAP